VVKNATINLRVNSEVKEQAGTILDAMGLTFSDAFNLLLHQIRIQRGLPFDVVAYSNRPTAQTLAFLDKVERGEEEIHGPFATKDDLWQSLGI
jgi:DNA-damage-inducible protein J